MAYMKQWHCGAPANDNFGENNNVSVNGIDICALSHGIDTQLHCDIQYFYAITPTRLIVYDVLDGWEEKPHRFKNIEEYSLKKEELVV